MGSVIGRWRYRQHRVLLVWQIWSILPCLEPLCYCRWRHLPHQWTRSTLKKRRNNSFFFSSCCCCNLLLSKSNVVLVTTTTTGGEVGWEYSGGGFSTVFERPSYQEDAVQQYLKKGTYMTLLELKEEMYHPPILTWLQLLLGGLPDTSYYSQSGRAIPDVSAFSTNYKVLIQNLWSGLVCVSFFLLSLSLSLSILFHHKCISLDLSYQLYRGFWHLSLRPDICS